MFVNKMLLFVVKAENALFKAKLIKTESNPKLKKGRDDRTLIEYMSGN